MFRIIGKKCHAKGFHCIPHLPVCLCVQSSDNPLQAAKLSLQESKRLNGQMKTQLLKNPEAQKKWEQLCLLPSRGGQKNTLKRLFLFNYVDSKEERLGPTIWPKLLE